MAKVESLTCALDLRDPSNSLSIASAKPSQEIRVLVRPEDDATAKLMEAVGILSNDGKSFSVVVTREDGAQQTHDLCYRDLLKALSDIDEIERSTERKDLCTKQDIYDIITEFLRKNPRAIVPETAFPEPYIRHEPPRFPQAPAA